MPELFSYIQDFVDSHPEPGRFIVTGSENLTLSQSISQSLAGRCCIVTLLPPSHEELRSFPSAPLDLMTQLWQGHYPRIYDKQIPAMRWLSDYVTTYVQRDVRQVSNITDLNAFTSFLKLCAGRTAQELNYSQLGADAGVSHNTTKAWISVLETSWLVFTLPAWFRNIRKQVVKSPKLHFVDTGLVCFLLGIKDPEQLRLHPLRGAIFETWVVSEIYKRFTNQGIKPSLYHYRESRGLEIDLVIELADRLNLVEIKSGSTINQDFFRNLNLFIEKNELKLQLSPWLVYGGKEGQSRQAGRVVGWANIPDTIIA